MSIPGPLLEYVAFLSFKSDSMKSSIAPTLITGWYPVVELNPIPDGFIQSLDPHGVLVPPNSARPSFEPKYASVRLSVLCTSVNPAPILWLLLPAAEM